MPRDLIVLTVDALEQVGPQIEPGGSVHVKAVSRLRQPINLIQSLDGRIFSSVVALGNVSLEVPHPSP